MFPYIIFFVFHSLQFTESCANNVYLTCLRNKDPHRNLPRRVTYNPGRGRRCGRDVDDDAGVTWTTVRA